MTPELAKALNELAIAVIAGITTIFLPWAFTIAKAYAQAKIASVKNKDMRAALEFALDRMDNTARTVVDEINQKLRDQAQAGDGKLDTVKAKQLLTVAYQRLSVRLPQDVTATLQQAYGDKLRDVLIGKIESKVAESKAC